MNRVLVTYGWVRSSYAVVRSLGRRGNCVYVGYSDVPSMAVYSRYCQKGVVLPDFFNDPETYVRAVAGACLKYGIEVLIPGHEDIYWLALYRELLPESLILIHPSVDSLSTASDKFFVIEAAKKAGCPAPRTRRFFSFEELDALAIKLDYPVVLKTRTGNSAKGVAVCDSKEQLKAKADYFIDTFRLGPDTYPVIQQYLPGRAIGTCHLFRNGEPVIAFSEKYLRAKERENFGTSTLRCAWDAPEAIGHANKILRHLNWHGVAHLDFIEDDQGRFRLIEINPRFWGALALSIQAGVDFPSLLLDMALGNKMQLPGPPKSNTVCRWLLGEGIGLLNCLAKGRVKQAFDILTYTGANGFDDLFLDDFLPFLCEIFLYGRRYLSSGSANPVSPGMIQGGK